LKLIWNPIEHVFEENTRWAHLRAIEWKALPAFITQPIVPLLLINYEIYEIIPPIMLSVFWWNPPNFDTLMGQPVDIIGSGHQ